MNRLQRWVLSARIARLQRQYAAKPYEPSVHLVPRYPIDTPAFDGCEPFAPDRLTTGCKSRWFPVAALVVAFAAGLLTGSFRAPADQVRADHAGLACSSQPETFEQ